MPLVTAPNVIEVSDFTGGIRPDAEPSNVPGNALLTASNLILDPASGALVTRKGFRRIGNNLGEGYVVKSLHKYNRVVGTTQGEYLIAVITNGAALAVMAIDLSTGTGATVDSGLAPTSFTGVHWGVTVQGTFYGGGDGIQMYSWNPDDGFDAAPAQQNFDILVNSRSPGAGEVAYDKAFEKGDKVRYATPTLQAYSASEGFKVKPWDVDRHYEKGDIVTRKSTYDDGLGNTGTTYRRAYKCKRDHAANAARRPGDGTESFATGRKKWVNFWRPLHLTLPRDADLEITSDWDLIPTAATTTIANWHGERMWMRYDDVDVGIGKSRAMYSAPSKPVKGSDIAELNWSPTDFRIGVGKRATDAGEGTGGGYQDFRTGDGDPITAFYSFGYYQLVFKRRSTHVVAGFDENSWVIRELDKSVGAVGPTAVCEHDGIVYFTSDQGLYYTDGTQVIPVPGFEAVRNFMRDTTDWSGELTGVVMASYQSFVWVSLPGTGFSLLYEPGTKTFWKVNLEMSSAITQREDGKTRLYFALADDARALVYEYDKSDAADADDDGGAAYGATPMTWSARFAWHPFGAVREERRIRRIWALIKGAAGVSGSLKAYRNYQDTAEFTKAIAPTTARATYFEGQGMKDSFAVNIELAGTGGGVAVLAHAIETQPRRVRYHS